MWPLPQCWLFFLLGTSGHLLSLAVATARASASVVDGAVGATSSECRQRDLVDDRPELQMSTERKRFCVI